jgi:hypothetical protein
MQKTLAAARFLDGRTSRPWPRGRIGGYADAAARTDRDCVAVFGQILSAERCMDFWILLAAFAGALGLRFAFLAANLRYVERLWCDYERRGPRYVLARWVDFATLIAFMATAVWRMWTFDKDDPYRLAKIFVVWLGWSLLTRLRVHRFPRTNVPGSYMAAKVDLVVHLVMSVVVALALTGASWIYFWWRE